MTALIPSILMFLQVVYYVMIIQVIMSWLLNFQVLNLNEPTVAKIWDLLNRALEPIYGPVRRILPPMSGVDFSPMVVIIGIILLRRFLMGYVGY